MFLKIEIISLFLFSIGWLPGISFDQKTLIQIAVGLKLSLETKVRLTNVETIRGVVHVDSDGCGDIEEELGNSSTRVLDLHIRLLRIS